MKFSTSVVAVAGLATQVSAKDIEIQVGMGGLKFTPNSVTAAVNDFLVFTFYPANHSVSSGEFSSGCTPSKSGGFYSGFVPTSAGTQPVSTAPQLSALPNLGTGHGLTLFKTKQFRVKVESTDPMAFYCTQPNNNHCKAGMYGVVNPSGQSTLQAYGALAKAASSNSSPQQGMFGGSLVAVGESGSDSGSNTSAGGSAPTGGPYGGGNGGGNGNGGGSGTTTGTGSQPTGTTRPNGASSTSAGLSSLLAAVAFAMFLV
jgi:plastocyanin